MATTSPALVQMLIGAIPPEDGAMLVARTGERARITSSAGSLDVGSAALTAEVIDGLSAQLLRPEHLQTLQATGTVHAEFVASNGAGQFELVASSTEDSRCLEVRRRNRSPESDSAAALPAPPSTETLVADLLSRRLTNDSSSSKQPSREAAEMATSRIADATPVADVPVGAPAAVAIAAAPDPAIEPSGSNGDLDLPANFEFAESTYNADDLTLPSGLVDDATTAAATAEASRPAVSKPSSTAAKKPERTSFGVRLSIGRLSWLLAAGIALAVGTPAAGWLWWTRHVSTGHAVTTAPARAAIPAPKVAQAVATPAVVNPAVVKPQTPPAAAADPSPARKLDTTPPPRPAAEPVVSRPTAPVPSPTTTAAAHATTAASPSRDGFSVQVAAVHTKDEADRIAARLTQQRYPAYVVKGEGAAASFYRVRIGAFPSHEAAEETARQIESADGTKPWVVKETR